jgi:V/A-type H+-transporting ATPase subunit E
MSMTEELQSLIERIQREALEKSEKQAADMIEAAERQAAALAKAAEENADAARRKAEQDAQVTTDRGRKALEQAARDMLLQVEQGVDEILTRIVQQTVDEVLQPDLVAEMLVRLAEAYGAKGGGETRIQALLSPADQDTVVSYVKGRLSRELAEGVEIVIDRDLDRGFRVVFEKGQANHDFSREAIAEALSAYLRPQLADMIRKAAKDPKSNTEDS